MPDQFNAHSISAAHPVAYFCAEFGFDPNLPIYAGGLGILAGDTLKQAADDAFPMIGVGLLYRGYGMRQRITEDGDQVDEDWLFDPLSQGLEHVYIDDMPLFIKVHLSEVDVWLRCWKKTFANGVVLYLLDSETDQNQLPERSITQVLYSGTMESQIKQQLILGIGGVKLLTALGIHPSLYHVNEGRPAFLHWQLIREMMDAHGISYDSARQLAIQKTVYTNHTLVAAGNQGYPLELLRLLSRYYAEKMNISVDELLRPGIDLDPNTFAITRFALNVSRKASGVSSLHTELSEEYWPQYHWVNVTNGVHFPTWQSSAIATVSKENSAERLWSTHQEEKNKLAEFAQRYTGYWFDPNRLVITWCRRIAGYKQLNVLFEDVERLRKILKHTDRPLQLLIAGKAHQGDGIGKDLLKSVIGYMQRELAGNALFLPNYNIEVAQHLVRGSDIWLNTPQLGKEACGTSGMKASANGVIQCSVPDGWAEEVNWKDIGWTLPAKDLSLQLYHLLENEIVPEFYDRANGVPIKWVEKMSKTIEMANQYSAKRMLTEYEGKLYQ
jgi:starch phosphorylase